MRLLPARTARLIASGAVLATRIGAAEWFVSTNRQQRHGQRLARWAVPLAGLAGPRRLQRHRRRWRHPRLGSRRDQDHVPASGIPTRVEGNFFGTNVAGTLPLPNGVVPNSSRRFAAVFGFGGGTCGMSVGSVVAGAGNLIAYSGGAGVHIAGCRNTPILGNTFFENGELPVDLSLNSGSDGPAPNDPGDADASDAVNGGNRLQNTKKIISMVEDVGNDQLRLNVRVDSTPSSAA